MKIYAVGGAVRDELLGLPVTDRDYVVVGATPAEMVKLGYKPVGRDFPVFLHPKTKEEYALARTERKTARGYHGFEFHAAPDVTLEEDLARRDLTINAIARDDAGNIIDPFGGAADLKARVLRHVGPAFAEDPVRILRVARFAARFGFSIAPATLQQMREMVAHGEADALVAERVWQELARGLMERRPSRMFEVLAECGAGAVVLPELAGLATGAAGARRLAALDAAAARGLGLAARFALIAMHAEERAIEILCERLRAPQDCRELAVLAARYCADVRKADKLPVEALLWLLQATDALRRPERFAQLLDVCAVAAGQPATAAAVARLRDALAAAHAVDAGAVAKSCRNAGEIKERVAQARVAAIKNALSPKPARARRVSNQGEAMLDFYTWTTPNGRKVSIMLEEIGLPYRVHAINIGRNDQFEPAFVAISPNSKIPAIVDPDGPDGEPYAMMESGAILIYLAGKTGRLLPQSDRLKFDALQWLMFQMGHVGPMFGQVHHFLRAAKEPVPYAIERYTKEKDRLYGVLDQRLAAHEYLADEYSIADIATYPWVARYEWHRTNLADFPHVKRWFDAISARPAVQRGMKVPAV
jgi:tRNA nucleotidyltransferase (CCA-adding enzyme)